MLEENGYNMNFVGKWNLSYNQLNATQLKY